MGWHGYLALWCAVFGAVALFGYGRSLAGMTRAQRTVRVRGRIERVREPRHGGSRRGGISVVVSYRDPSTGREVTVTNDGECGESITAAWTGREVGVHYPRGRPHAYRLTSDLGEGGRGLGWPNFAVFLIYVGAVVVAAVDWGWPWALVGVGGPWAVFGACRLPGNIRDTRRRREKLAAMVAARGRVVAVLRDVSTDAEGGTSTSITPVVAFTARGGAAVTAHCASGVPDPAGAYGREVTVHYAPDDPAVFTLDRAGELRSVGTDTAVNVVALLVVAAAAVVGAVLL
ncbi:MULTISPECIES: DUF3592 domain-containing protein [unclassified Kitasatospora]|uniref:DUF3592 domain-containing protein n=1 Tax=unclassified Kitasatospora TaxID=2633591 RepID=UPI0033D1B4FA